MTKRFNKAYNALVKAYFEGTLAKGSCTACAVGNMICDAQNFKIDLKTINNHSYRELDIVPWYDAIWTNSDHNKIIHKKVKELTGYNNEEIRQIERAFENNTRIGGKSYDRYTAQEILEDQYNGLCAVVDVLLELDGLKDNGHKAKFKEHPKYESSNH